MYILDGVSSAANFNTAYEEPKYNRDSHFLIHNVFFVSKSNLFDVYSTEAISRFGTGSVKQTSD